MQQVLPSVGGGVKSCNGVIHRLIHRFIHSVGYHPDSAHGAAEAEAVDREVGGFRYRRRGERMRCGR